MAWFGHSGSQTSQLMHSSVIFKAILFPQKNMFLIYPDFAKDSSNKQKIIYYADKKLDFIPFKGIKDKKLLKQMVEGW